METTWIALGLCGIRVKVVLRRKPKIAVIPTARASSAVTRKPPDSDVSRLVATAFAAVPTVFGRLVFASYMLDRGSGFYICPLASVAFGYEEVSRVMSETHRALLATWLRLPAIRQNSDLRRYLTGMDDNHRDLVDRIIRDRRYADLLPAVATAEQVDRFLGSLDRAFKTVRTTL
jgi:hypothetical protein